MFGRVWRFQKYFTFSSFGSGSKARWIPIYTSDRPNSGCCFILPFGGLLWDRFLPLFSFRSFPGWHNTFWEFTHFRHKIINCQYFSCHTNKSINQSLLNSLNIFRTFSGGVSEDTPLCCFDLCQRPGHVSFHVFTGPSSPFSDFS